MMPIARLTDDDLVEVANTLAGDLSYYVAGWDFQNTRHEAPLEAKCRRQFRPVADEMKRRGLELTRPSLVSL